MSEDMFYCSFVSIHYIICECGETFPTENELKIHLEKEHPHKKERKEYKCGVCEEVFSTEQACIQHYEEEHIKIEVKQEHDYTETKPPSPANGNAMVGYLYNTTDSSHGYRISKTSICEVCGEIYLSSGFHSCSEDAESQEFPVKKAKKTNNIKKVVCEVCGKKYASNAALRYHQRVHTGEKPYKCTQCDKSFTMPLFLQIHIRTHTGEKPFACGHPHCRKAFSNKAALLRHDRVHTGVKPYECSYCGKCFTQSNSMKLHITTVHLKLPTPYKSRNRRIKAKEREERAKNLTNGNTEMLDVVEEVPGLSDVDVQFIKPEVCLDEEILYEDERDVTYEIIYQEE